ncbi:MAG: YfcL family protein [Aeromonadaceae bacterium]|nr:YfcL family protein [Aeromonadaceae bacterium]
MKTIFEFERVLLNLIDALVSTGTADELFASGYLRGHISLAVAHCEIDGRNHIQDVKHRVLAGLQEACISGELSDKDQKLVLLMWQRLLQQAESQLA